MSDDPRFLRPSPIASVRTLPTDDYLAAFVWALADRKGASDGMAKRNRRKLIARRAQRKTIRRPL